MSQSKAASITESCLNTVLGIILSTVFTQVICMIYNIELSIDHNLIITFWLTVISFLRQYFIRRFFNKRGEV